MDDMASLSVSGLLTRPTTLESSEPVRRAIGLLKSSNAYELFVMDGARFAGVLTIRDLLKAKNIASMKLSALTTRVPQLAREDSVGLAARIMTDHRVRAVPVVEEGELIGQLTARSICGQIMQKRRLNIDAAEIMTSNPLFLREDAPVSKARTLMIERSIDHLPVLRGREITGILTSDMIVFRMAPTRRISLGSLVAQARRRFDVSASGLMSTDPVVSSPDTDVAQVIGAMERRRTAYSLVALWGELQGIITYRDCVKLLAEPKKETLPISIVGLPEDPFEAEATKAKFERVVKRIAKSLPDLLEARSVIKTFDKTGHRRRYEVNVELITPRRRIPFSESGWELAEIYDEISNRMKRVTTKPKQKTRRRVH